MTDPTPCDIHGRLMLSPPEGGEPVCDFCVVVAAEQERCAKVADDYSLKEHEDLITTGSSILYYSDLIAAAIRALKESDD